MLQESNSYQRVPLQEVRGTPGRFGTPCIAYLTLLDRTGVCTLYWRISLPQRSPLKATKLTLYTPLGLGEAQCPLILNVDYDLSDIESSETALHSSRGPPGQAQCKTVVLSMSGYGNSPTIDYAASQNLRADECGVLYGEAQSLGNAGYIAYEQHEYAGLPTQYLSEDYGYIRNQLAYSSTTYCPPRTGYNMAQTSMPEQRLPVVVSWGPKQGSEGTLLNVDLQSHYDLALSSTPIVSLRFADIDCPATLSRLDTKFVVVSTVPKLATGESFTSQVLVSVQLRDRCQMVVNTIQVGLFRYNSQHRAGTVAPQGTGRCKVAELIISPTLWLLYSSHFSQIFALPDDTSQVQKEIGWSSSHAAVNGRAQTQALSVTPSSRVPSFFTHSRTSEPPLFRTSERLKRLNEEQVAIADMNDLPKPPTITKVPDSAEARLEINGKVDSMTEGWTSDERNAKRRLVYFWRTQMEHVIYTNFAPWSSEARVPKERCISCFWWEKRQDYFVTSVDIIRLCGQLAGGNIVVGEKNRIRRNVDIYDKETIYKDHPDTEDIFSLVMGFTSPKPKNIEKAIKVFPWRNLGAAIVKVVNKWSADYSNTPSSLGFIEDHRSGAFGPTSQPHNLLPERESQENNDGKEYYSPSPHSASYPVHSYSHSSAHSTSGASFASPTASPNVPPAVYTQHWTNTLPVHTHATVPGPVNYDTSVHSYPQSDAIGSQNPNYITMAAGQPVRGSWNFSGLGTRNPNSYRVENDDKK
ncbi:MAG: hypothetical protein L6R40_002558 [Gallowayella cf. fulva]|nr:MAG: hypothetical protein L6R40_002558 [Xanthomendoza cf. fulva]